MENLPVELCLNVFQFLDHQNVAAALQVCRKWKKAASEDSLWLDLFRARWGADRADFFSPHYSKSWKELYGIQHRCDRYGLGLKMIREGNDCYLIHQGEIQRHLGRCGGKKSKEEGDEIGEEEGEEEAERCAEISDRILFFIADLEAACAEAKRSPF